MRVLVTGAAGFLGVHLCERYLRLGHEVVGLDNLVTGSRKNIDYLEELASGRFCFIEEDVSNSFYVPQGKVDLIFHFASPASPVDFGRLAFEIIDANVSGTRQCLQLAEQDGAILVFASTSEVYGDARVSPQPEDYSGNVDVTSPRAVYDEAKRMGEVLCYTYNRVCDVDIRVARIFNTYGPRMRIDDGRVIPNFIRAVLRGEEMELRRYGRATRSFCYVEDTIEALVRLVDVPGVSPMNIGNDREIRIEELGELIADFMGVPKSFRRVEGDIDEPFNRRPDLHMMKKHLNFEPRWDLDRGLKETIRWFRLRP